MTRVPAPHRHRIEIVGLRSLPEIQPGDDLAQLVFGALQDNGATLQRGDVVVLTQKIVSKAEGQLVRLSGVTPSALARQWARHMRADPRLVEVVLRESRRVVRMNERVLITETHHGFVCANAGVDASNLPERGVVSCLPRDPDASARRIARRLRQLLRIPVAVVVSDTWGRAWRLGLTNVAIGAAGLRVLEDLRGRRDACGRRLHATILAVADDLAAAAGLVMGKGEKIPVAIIRGYRYRPARETARQLLRPPQEDLFR